MCKYTCRNAENGGIVTLLLKYLNPSPSWIPVSLH